MVAFASLMMTAVTAVLVVPINGSRARICLCLGWTISRLEFNLMSLAVLSYLQARQKSLDVRIVVKPGQVFFESCVRFTALHVLQLLHRSMLVMVCKRSRDPFFRSLKI